MSHYMANIARGGSFKVGSWVAGFDGLQFINIEFAERSMDDASIAMSVPQAQQLVADLLEAIAKIPESA